MLEEKVEDGIAQVVGATIPLPPGGAASRALARVARPGTCGWCGKAEETQAHLLWVCTTFADIRRKYFPDMKERDPLVLPGLLRSAAIGPEPILTQGATTGEEGTH